MAANYPFIFYFLSFIAIFCALMVVFSKNPVHSVLYLVATFFAIAGHYLLLNAQFLAAVHIIVYAGAIMVLFLYVIMMLNLNKEVEPNKSIVAKFAAVISGGLLMIVVVSAMKGVDAATISQHSDIGLVETLGNVLYNKYMLPFEMVSVLFLTAIVGAVMLGKKDIK